MCGEYLVSGSTNSSMFYFPPAIFVALHGSVIVDVFTIERVDLGVGMTMVSSGLAGFLVLPLAGYFSLTQRYGVNLAIFLKESKFTSLFLICKRFCVTNI